LYCSIKLLPSFKERVYQDPGLAFNTPTVHDIGALIINIMEAIVKMQETAAVETHSIVDPVGAWFYPNAL